MHETRKSRKNESPVTQKIVFHGGYFPFKMLEAKSEQTSELTYSIYQHGHWELVDNTR